MGAKNEDKVALRPAEEIAREMVSEPIGINSEWGFGIFDGVTALRFDGWIFRRAAMNEREDLVRIVAHLIERGRAEGVAAERARIIASLREAMGDTPWSVAQVLGSVANDLESGRLANSQNEGGHSS